MLSDLSRSKLRVLRNTEIHNERKEQTEFDPADKRGWMHDDPLCATIGSDLFYPEKNASHHAIQAKLVCQSCHLLNACRDYAVRYETQGVWGGMTPRERAAYRRNHNIKFISNPVNVY